MALLISILCFAVAIWATGFTLTWCLLWWSTSQPTGWNGSMLDAAKASALWYLTLPLAFVVIQRMRAALPYVEAALKGQLPFRVQVNVVEPDKRVWKTTVDILCSMKWGVFHAQ